MIFFLTTYQTTVCLKPIYSQVDFAIKCLKHVVQKNLAAIEPKTSAQEQFVTKLQKSFKGTVWKGGMFNDILIN